MKNKNFNLFNLLSKTYKGRKMFGFMDYGELSRMDKVDKPIRQTEVVQEDIIELPDCLLYTSPSPRDGLLSRMPSSA